MSVATVPIRPAATAWAIASKYEQQYDGHRNTDQYLARMISHGRNKVTEKLHISRCRRIETLL